MKKKLLFVFTLSLLSACSSIKPTYNVVEANPTKKPIWVENTAKYEKTSEADSSTYKYFKSGDEPQESINRRLCVQSAVASSKKKIASEINEMLESIYEQSAATNEKEKNIELKKEQIEHFVSSRLVGIENRENYVEKRKYLVEKGADKDETKYACWNLSRVKRKVHDNIINDMISIWIKEIKDPTLQSKVSEKLYKSAEKYGVEIKE